MNPGPLLDSHWVIIVHAVAAIVAMLLGCFQLITEKGTTLHRGMGRLWVVLMALVAISSFGIHEFKMLGPFSVIHLLSLLTLYTLWEGVSAIRAGDVAGHKKSMITAYVLALLVTGVFTLWPGRVMHQVFFG